MKRFYWNQLKLVYLSKKKTSNFFYFNLLALYFTHIHELYDKNNWKKRLAVIKMVMKARPRITIFYAVTYFDHPTLPI